MGQGDRPQEHAPDPRLSAGGGTASGQGTGSGSGLPRPAGADAGHGLPDGPGAVAPVPALNGHRAGGAADHGADGAGAAVPATGADRGDPAGGSTDAADVADAAPVPGSVPPAQDGLEDGLAVAADAAEQAPAPRSAPPAQDDLEDGLAVAADAAEAAPVPRSAPPAQDGLEDGLAVADGAPPTGAPTWTAGDDAYREPSAADRAADDWTAPSPLATSETEAPPAAPPDDGLDLEAQAQGVAPAIEPAEVLPPVPPPAPPGGGGGEPPEEPPSGPSSGAFADRPMSVVEHLDELRRRLFWIIGSVLVGVSVSFAFVYPLLRFLEQPIHGFKLYFTGPLDPLFAIVKITVACGLILASPVIIYQLVAYVLPALQARERRLLFSYLPAAVLLFAAGMAFGFFIFVPLVISAMFRFAGTALNPLLTIDRYVSFLLSFTLPFGIVFELPVIVVTLVKVGVLTPQTLAAGRRYALMLTVVVAAIFAPPDPITPLVMAAPIYGLYEVSIWVARLAYRNRATAD